jgi:6-phosphogluconolactonase (cycloisomerase 2 family)
MQPGKLGPGYWGSAVGAASVLALALSGAVAQAGSTLQLVDEIDAPGVVVGAPGFDTVVLSADGAFAYVSLREADAVAVYGRDPLTGHLSLVEVQSGGELGVPDLDGPSPMVISPDGGHLYVATIESERIVRFDRDLSTGRLTFAASDPGPELPSRIVITPDGRSLLAGSGKDLRAFDSEASALFSREPTSGALTQYAHVAGGPNIVSAAMTADGARWFLGGEDRPRRSAVVGSWAGSVQNGFYPTLPFEFWREEFGFDFPPVRDVALTPDETQLVTITNHSLTLFDRSPEFFPRRFFRYYEYDTQAIPGLAGPRDLAVNPDGVHVYAAGWGRGDRRSDRAGNLASFRRTSAGDLVYVESLSALQIDSLKAANSIAVSADGRFVYVAGLETGRLAVFEARPTCAPAPLEGCGAARAAKLVVSDQTGFREQELRYTWKSSATPTPFQGDPLGGTSYALCIYGDDGGTPSLIGSLDVPQGRFEERRGWKRSGTAGLPTRYAYSDYYGVPDGVRAASLTTRRMTFRAKGPNAPLLSLPLQAPLTVQVVSSIPQCWTASFSAADVRPFDPARGKYIAVSRTP